MIRTICITIAVLCLVSFTSPAEAKFSDNQIAVMKMAYKHGNRIQWRGEGWGRTFAAVIWQESKGNWKRYQVNGVVVGDMDRHGNPKSLGPSQMQLLTARDIERWYPILFKLKFGPYSPTDEELIIALLIDIEFNIQCGAAYFDYLLHLKNDWRKAVLAYNRGPGGIGDPNDYVSKVTSWRKTIIPKII